MFTSDYFQALEDYKRARRSAAIQELLSRLAGNPEDTKLLSYDEVRQQLQAVEKSSVHLAEIPLDAIVGSVGRYHDFTRKYLPKKSINQERWARIMASTKGLEGLPPIEVYQVGKVYFVKDGNHRVSVARQMGNRTIQAYITEVESKVDFPTSATPDDLIIKREQLNFLNETKLDQAIDDLDLVATKAGAYPTLLEHIAVHRHYLGNTLKREIPYEEASLSWYREVYLPVKRTIDRRDLLCDFPDRTALDLYLWAADHRAALNEQIGWDIGPEAALAELSNQRPGVSFQTISLIFGNLLQRILPDILEPGPPPGTWREKLSQLTVLESLFRNIIVAIDDSPNAWHALDMAIILGKSERSRIRGIHIHTKTDKKDHQKHNQYKNRFETQCSSEGIKDWNFLLAEGDVWKVLLDRSRYADLVVLPLNHPPEDKPLSWIGSGITNLIRSCPVPVLTIPQAPQSLNTLVLAYDGSPKAREALFMAAYIGTQLGSKIIVITSKEGLSQSETISNEAKRYLQSFPTPSEFIITSKGVSSAILDLHTQDRIDLILIGGYGGSTFLPVMLGSIVDQILREIQLPVLICR
jgi:nucleotide-binding universal stress UspA family protein